MSERKERGIGNQWLDHERESASGRARLLARIERQYRTETSLVRVGQLTLDFTRIADSEQVLVQMEQAADCAWQPYWAEAWSSGKVLAQLLETRRLEGQRVLDLGCGLGLTGTVAAARGAWVMMADSAPPALLLARLNSWPWRRRVVCRTVDWREARPLGPAFDILVGADILYDVSDWDYLEAFWRRHVRAGGTVLLGEPGRTSGREFPAWLTQRGWEVRQIAVTSREKAEGAGSRILEATFRDVPTGQPMTNLPAML